MEKSDDYAVMAAAAEILLSMRHHPIPPDYVPEWCVPPLATIPSSSSPSTYGGCSNLDVDLLDLPVKWWPWTRRRRSRQHTLESMAKARESRLRDEAKVVTRKRSPETPLEFSGGSGESTSFGDEGTDMVMSVHKRRRRQTVVKLEAEAGGGGFGCGFDEGTDMGMSVHKRRRRQMVMKLEAEAGGGGFGCGFDEGTSRQEQPVKKKIRIVGFGKGERKHPVCVDLVSIC